MEGGQSLNIEGSTRRTVVAGSVTEKKGSVVTVPINMSSNPLKHHHHNQVLWSNDGLLKKLR